MKAIRKDIIYLLQLKNYGVFDYIEVVKEGVKYLEPLYRFIDVDHEYTETREDNAGTEYLANMVAVKCYIGSSHYNSEQMSHLINGTVNDCMDLGIDVMTAEEIENLLLNWEGRDRYE